MIVKMPLVSICVPVCNNACYLRQCLDSIAAQSYKNIEVIIGDDGSTDETEAIAQEYHDRYGYSVYRNPSNRGAAAISTTLVQMARGSHVAVYHSDDVYEKTIIEESVKVLESDAGVGLVGTMATIVNIEGESSAEFHLHNALLALNKNSYTFDEVMLGVLKNGRNDIIMVTPSVMARKDCYQELGFYKEKYKDIYDYEMWLRIATRYRVSIVDKN
jgi:glycosyltransferase involved in cell wall biosynthesis